MSKIDRVTIVNSQGVCQYEVGGEHGGLTIDCIEDKGIEYPDSFHSIYIGYTKDKQIVFETYNAPTEVRYRAE